MHENGFGHGIEVTQWTAHVERAYEGNAQRLVAALSRAYGRSIVEDAVQDAFARALSWTPTADRLDNLMNFHFMKRCTVRILFRYIRTDIRRACRERRRSSAARTSAAGACTPDMLLEAKERCDLAVKVFDELPSWQRPVVQMILVGSRTRRDVARITGVRSTTQNNWRHKFVTDLRHRLDPRD
jgi:DNA-directed RNA polymerase specialized sigma24 family protein